MANRQTKICSSNYQRNANQNYNEVPPQLVRIDIIKKPTKNKCWKRYEEKGTLIHCWWECQFMQSLWKTVERFRKITRNRITIWFSNPNLEYIPRQNYTSKDACTPMVIAALLTIVRTWKQPKCPSTVDGIKKVQWNTTQPQKNKTMPFAATWMDLEIIVLSELRKWKTNI